MARSLKRLHIVNAVQQRLGDRHDRLVFQTDAHGNVFITGAHAAFVQMAEIWAKGGGGVVADVNERVADVNECARAHELDDRAAQWRGERGLP